MCTTIVFSFCAGGVEDYFALFFLLLLLVAASPVCAHLHGHEESEKSYNLKSPENTQPFQAIEHNEEYYGCGGYLRAGYIQTNRLSASALAGELGCGHRVNQYIKAHLGVFASLDSGLNSHSDQNIQSDFFNQKTDSYLIVGEAVLTLTYGDFEAHLGRQNVDSPHFDADDLRLIANLYEAYLLDYHFSEQLYVGSGFIREASGWENGGNSSQFISIGEALGGESSGAWVSWINYQQDHYSNESWFYYIPHHLMIFYTGLDFTGQLYDGLSYTVAVQYDWGREVGSPNLGAFEAHTLGFMAAMNWSNLTATAAYNKNFGETGAVSSVGGGPFFTSMEQLTLDAVNGEGAQSIMLNLEYDVHEYLAVGVAIAKFSADNSSNFNQEEMNFYVNYSWHDKFTTELMYAAINDKNPGADFQQFRAILTYRY